MAVSSASLKDGVGISNSFLMIPFTISFAVVLVRICGSSLRSSKSVIKRLNESDSVRSTRFDRVGLKQVRMKLF